MLQCFHHYAPGVLSLNVSLPVRMWDLWGQGLCLSHLWFPSVKGIVLRRVQNYCYHSLYLFIFNIQTYSNILTVSGYRKREREIKTSSPGKTWNEEQRANCFPLLAPIPTLKKSLACVNICLVSLLCGSFKSKTCQVEQCGLNLSALSKSPGLRTALCTS